ncbi:SRPBCC family protein [Qaidamihabitans albus]|uniref:SRPBCC family protein n=1 Tax=Qaidamihabitans albus TaxID=2795733 RepID=UPI0018F22116|nr:SRPBCC family protein [Qaidamihabitans albus]
MKPTPTGRIFPTTSGYDLVVTRTFRAPADDVWASVTEPERTARWFGPWKGEAGPGRTIQVQMAFEEEAPWCDLRVDACEPPTHLAASMTDEAGTWRMELNLSETGGTTELRFVQHLDSPAGAGEIGPGWEYYLDMLVAARAGEPLPDFGDYYPAQQAYYQEQAG